MKNTYITTTLLLAVVIAISLLGLHTDTVIGQTQGSSSSSSSSGNAVTSSSSSSSGEIATSLSSSSSSSSSSSGVIVLNKDFTGIWKAKVTRCNPIGGSSSSSGCIVCAQVLPECSSGQVFAQQTCVACAHCEDVASSSSSSSGAIVTSSSSSSGSITTDFCVMQGSIVVMLKLCVIDDVLQGVLHQGDVFDKAVITSQNVISENEVTVNLQDKKDKTAKLTLKLLGERQLRGTFDNGQTFEARKLNSFRACFAPGHEGKPLFGNGNKDKDNDNNGNDNGNHKGPNHEVPNGPKYGPPFGMSGMVH